MTNGAGANTGAPGLDAIGIAPALTVNDLETSRKFYVDGLGFEVADKTEVDGKVRFMMLKAGGAFLGIGQDDFAKGRDRVKGQGVRMWISTEQDIKALGDRAKAAGITLDNDPEPLPWGPLAFALKDPDGYLITIAASS